MEQNISANQKPIGDIFCDDYTFLVPRYQRPYAWELQQAIEMLEDLEGVMEGDGHSEDWYFLGSIVLVKNSTDRFASIIDGQQRITTLTILLSVLRDLTNEPIRKRQRDNYIKQQEDFDRGLSEQVRLQLREKDKQFFFKTVQELDATLNLPEFEQLSIDSQWHIVENATYYHQELSKWDEQKRNKLVQFIINKCYLVVVEVPTDNSARRIFSVLNTRGLDLIATDILKANLLMRDEKNEEELSKKWEEIEHALGREEFNDLFTHIRMIFEREKPRSALEDGFPEIVHTFKDDPKLFITDTLEPYAETFLLTKDYSEIERRFDMATVRLMKSLNELDNKDWIPPLLYCVNRFGERKFGQESLCAFIKKLERLAYYHFVTRANVNTRISRYAKVLDDLHQDKQQPEQSNSLKLNEEEITDFFDALDGPVYLKQRVVRPLMLRLDMALHDGTAIYDYPTITVEHVSPITIGAGSQWETWFTDIELHTRWLHRIANLVLLNRRKNSSASNWDFERKKLTYFTKDGATPFWVTKLVDEKFEWTPSVLELRQQDLLRKLAISWMLEEQLDNWIANQ